MRAIAIVIAGFVILFSISIIAYYNLNQTSEILQVELSAAENQLLSGDWNQALVRIQDMQSKWSEYKKWWAIFLNHETLNNIQVSLNRMEQFIITEDKPHSLAELHTLLVLLEDVPQSEMLKIYNIF